MNECNTYFKFYILEEWNVTRGCYNLYIQSGVSDCITENFEAIDIEFILET